MPEPERQQRAAEQDLNCRLSRISTQWTLVFQAHQGETDEAGLAQTELLQRYGGAAYRYLLGALRDADAAQDLAQEFALRFLRGDFRRSDPQRGRFRDYLKTSLSHLVTDFHRARLARPQLLPAEAPEPAAPAAGSSDDDKAFLTSWREELLERVWQSLAQANPTFHAALLLRVDNPDMTSARMAEQMTARLGKPVSPELARKALQRAHAKFADLVVEEVAHSIASNDRAEVTAELAALDLLRYCRSAVERQVKNAK